MMNKYFFFLSTLLLIFFSGCNAADNLSEEEDLADLLEGEWHCRNFDITLRFDNGKTQHVANSFNTGEAVLSFEVDKVEEGYISGTITNNGIFGNYNLHELLEFGYMLYIFQVGIKKRIKGHSIESILS